MRIPPAHIEVELDSTERIGAIRHLLSRLVHAGAISRTDEPDIFAAFSEREEILSTGIGFRVALPHVTSDGVREPVFAFGRSRNGIDFDSIDDAPVEFVFLFILPSVSLSRQERVKLLARICRPLANRHTQEKLRGCSTAKEISSVLKNTYNDDDRSS